MKEFKIRVPDEFHAKIVDAAKENNRSAQAEYMDRLEKSFKNDDQLTRIEKMLKAVADRVGVFR